jgi:hypothetical protein
MKHKQIISISSILCLIVILVSCKKEEEEPEVTVGEGYFISNNGSYATDNGGITYVDKETGETLSSGNLGDTEQSPCLLGDTLFVPLFDESKILLLNARDFTSRGEIATNLVSPRALIAAEGKIIVIDWNGYGSNDGFVNFYDRSTLSYLGQVSLGYKPEDIYYADGKVYISNAAGLGSDNQVHVITVSSMTLDATWTTAANPKRVRKDKNGNFWITCNGNIWADPDVAGVLLKVNASGVELQRYTFGGVGTRSLNINSTGDQLVYIHDGDIYSHSIDEDPTEPLISGDFFGLELGADDKILTTDAGDFVSDGTFRVYSSTGVLESASSVGVTPSWIIEVDFD